MKKSEVDKILAKSSQDEWIVDDETGNFTYKKDLSLRIERPPYEDYMDEKVEEPWATDNPDSNALAVEYIIKYNNSFVDRKVLVSVDGGRALLPYPKSVEELVVTEKSVNFAKLVSIVDRVDEYIRRSDFEVIPSEDNNGWGF